MENINYANMANELLGNDMYSEFIKEIAKENKGENLINFSNEVLNKCCFLIIAIGMSKKIKLDNVKLCVGKNVIDVSCKEFEQKYRKYVQTIEESL